MARVDLDFQNLKTGCILNLTDTINVVSRTLNYFDYFDIPFDFSKKNELKEVESKLRTVKRELNDIKNWITNSDENYNILINNLNSQTNKLPTYQVKQRNNII